MYTTIYHFFTFDQNCTCGVAVMAFSLQQNGVMFQTLQQSSVYLLWLQLMERNIKKEKQEQVRYLYSA